MKRTLILFFILLFLSGCSLFKKNDPSPEETLDLQVNPGLSETEEVLESIEEVKFIEFDHNDVARHPLVAKIVKAYQKKINDKNWCIRSRKKVEEIYC